MERFRREKLRLNTNGRKKQEICKKFNQRLKISKVPLIEMKEFRKAKHKIENKFLIPKIT